MNGGRGLIEDKQRKRRKHRGEAGRKKGKKEGKHAIFEVHQ